MEDKIQANREAQRAACGEFLREAFDRIKEAFDLNQSMLADVLRRYGTGPLAPPWSTSPRTKISSEPAGSVVAAELCGAVRAQSRNHAMMVQHLPSAMV